MPSAFRVMLIYGSTRDGRMCDRVAKLVRKSLEQTGHVVDEVDPLKLGLPLLTNALQFMPDQSKASPELKQLNERVKQADGYVLLSPEYNRNITPALTNTLDYCPPASYARKVSAVVSYSMGPLGGEAAGIQVRTLMVEMGALPIPQMVSIPVVHELVNEHGETSDERIKGSMAKMIENFDWWMDAAKSKRTV